MKTNKQKARERAAQEYLLQQEKAADVWYEQRLQSELSRVKSDNEFNEWVFGAFFLIVLLALAAGGH
jgi:hypothetical protein